MSRHAVHATLGGRNPPTDLALDIGSMTVDQRFTPAALARLAFAVSARETADLCRDMVERLGDPDLTPVDRLGLGREMRFQSAITWQRLVLSELLLGGDEPAWAEIADLIGWSEGSLRAQFEEIADMWRADPASIDLGQATTEGTVGQVNDRDPVGTAQALDLWLLRICPPWGDERRSNPVEYALTHSG